MTRAGLRCLTEARCRRSRIALLLHASCGKSIPRPCRHLQVSGKCPEIHWRESTSSTSGSGRGVVEKVEGAGDNRKATVRFENAGVKQLLLKFARFKVCE